MEETLLPRTSIETSLVPRAPAPVVTDVQPRCWRCRRMLANSLTRPWSLSCPRCHAKNDYPAAITP